MKAAQKPFLIGEGENAVLLIHGFTGSPHQLREFGEYLASRGFRVYAPLLPGHESRTRSMRVTRAEWIECVEESLEFLKEESAKNLFVSGLSLGGVLTLYLGETHAEIRGLLPICAPVYLNRRLHFLFSAFGKFVTSVRELLYLMKEVREKLSVIKQPILIAQGRKDRIVPPDNANYIFENVSSSVKRILWLDNSGHVATFSVDKHLLFREAAEFFSNALR